MSSFACAVLHPFLLLLLQLITTILLLVHPVSAVEVNVTPKGLDVSIFSDMIYPSLDMHVVGVVPNATAPSSPDDERTRCGIVFEDSAFRNIIISVTIGEFCDINLTNVEYNELNVIGSLLPNSRVFLKNVRANSPAARGFAFKVDPGAVPGVVNEASMIVLEDSVFERSNSNADDDDSLLLQGKPRDTACGANPTHRPVCIVSPSCDFYSSSKTRSLSSPSTILVKNSTFISFNNSAVTAGGIMFASPEVPNIAHVNCRYLDISVVNNTFVGDFAPEATIQTAQGTLVALLFAHSQMKDLVVARNIAVYKANVSGGGGGGSGSNLGLYFLAQSAYAPHVTPRESTSFTNGGLFHSILCEDNIISLEGGSENYVATVFNLQYIPAPTSGGGLFLARRAVFRNNVVPISTAKKSSFLVFPLNMSVSDFFHVSGNVVNYTMISWETHSILTPPTRDVALFLVENNVFLNTRDTYLPDIAIQGVSNVTRMVFHNNTFISTARSPDEITSSYAIRFQFHILDVSEMVFSQNVFVTDGAKSWLALVAMLTRDNVFINDLLFYNNTLNITGSLDGNIPMKYVLPHGLFIMSRRGTCAFRIAHIVVESNIVHAITNYALASVAVVQLLYGDIVDGLKSLVLQHNVVSVVGGGEVGSGGQKKPTYSVYVVYVSNFPTLTLPPSGFGRFIMVNNTVDSRVVDYAAVGIAGMRQPVPAVEIQFVENTMRVWNSSRSKKRKLFEFSSFLIVNWDSRSTDEVSKSLLALRNITKLLNFSRNTYWVKLSMPTDFFGAIYLTRWEIDVIIVAANNITATQGQYPFAVYLREFGRTSRLEVTDNTIRTVSQNAAMGIILVKGGTISTAWVRVNSSVGDLIVVRNTLHCEGMLSAFQLTYLDVTGRMIINNNYADVGRGLYSGGGYLFVATLRVNFYGTEVFSMQHNVLSGGGLIAMGGEVRAEVVLRNNTVSALTRSSLTFLSVTEVIMNRDMLVTDNVVFLPTFSLLQSQANNVNEPVEAHMANQLTFFRFYGVTLRNKAWQILVANNAFVAASSTTKVGAGGAGSTQQQQQQQQGVVTSSYSEFQLVDSRSYSGATVDFVTETRSPASSASPSSSNNNNNDPDARPFLLFENNTGHNIPVRSQATLFHQFDMSGSCNFSLFGTAVLRNNIFTFVGAADREFSNIDSPLLVAVALVNRLFVPPSRISRNNGAPLQVYNNTFLVVGDLSNSSKLRKNTITAVLCAGCAAEYSKVRKRYMYFGVCNKANALCHWSVHSNVAGSLVPDHRPSLILVSGLKEPYSSNGSSLRFDVYSNVLKKVFNDTVTTSSNNSKTGGMEDLPLLLRAASSSTTRETKDLAFGFNRSAFLCRTLTVVDVSDSSRSSSSASASCNIAEIGYIRGGGGGGVVQQWRRRPLVGNFFSPAFIFAHIVHGRCDSSSMSATRISPTLSSTAETPSRPRTATQSRTNFSRTATVLTNTKSDTTHEEGVTETLPTKSPTEDSVSCSASSASHRGGGGGGLQQTFSESESRPTLSKSHLTDTMTRTLPPPRFASVVPPSLRAATTLASVLVGASAGGPFLTAFKSSAILGLSNCPGPVGNLDFASNPLSMQFGSGGGGGGGGGSDENYDDLSSHRGAMVGDAIIILAVFVLLHAVTFAVAKRRGSTFEETAPDFACPSFFAAFLYVYLPIMVSAAASVVARGFFKTSSSGGHFSAGFIVVSLLVVGAFVVFVVYDFNICSNFRDGERVVAVVYGRDAEEEEEDASNIKKNNNINSHVDASGKKKNKKRKQKKRTTKKKGSSSKRQQSSSSSSFSSCSVAWLWLMAPAFEWQASSSDFVKRYGYFIDGYLVPPHFALFDAVVAALLGILAGAAMAGCTERSACCGSIAITCAILSAFHSFLTIAYRPFSNRFDNMFYIVASVLTTVATVVQVVALKGTEDAVDALAKFETIMQFLTIYELAIFLLAALAILLRPLYKAQVGFGRWWRQRQQRQQNQNHQLVAVVDDQRPSSSPSTSRRRGIAVLSSPLIDRAEEGEEEEHHTRAEVDVDETESNDDEEMLTRPRLLLGGRARVGPLLAARASSSADGAADGEEGDDDDRWGTLFDHVPSQLVVSPSAYSTPDDSNGDDNDTGGADDVATDDDDDDVPRDTHHRHDRRQFLRTADFADDDDHDAGGQDMSAEELQRLLGYHRDTQEQSKKHLK